MAGPSCGPREGPAGARDDDGPGPGAGAEGSYERVLVPSTERRTEAAASRSACDAFLKDHECEVEMDEGSEPGAMPA